jgi:hypothetical protein
VIHIDHPHQEAKEIDWVDPGGGNVVRLRWHAMDEGIQHFLGDGADGNQSRAEAPPDFSLHFECPCNILYRDQFGLDQQIT